MANENWQQIREIFDDALRCKPDERGEFVRSACAGRESLLAEVESLLEELDEAEDFLEIPAFGKVTELMEPEDAGVERGKCFGHYEIVEQLGAGGMGEVYLARDRKLDRRVAVKILNKKIGRDESSLKRFVAEAKAASALNHPNILVIHEIGTDGDAHYIISEFVKGRTLRQVLKQSSMKLVEILDYAIQIAGALAAAHEARLVHRDIKPENIMIRPDGFVKVLDFGLAKLVRRKNKSVLGIKDSTVSENQTAKGVILGTVNYMSPEQAMGESVDERTDIFSLGVLVYEMVTGKTPFAGESMAETFANLINQEPAPLTHYAPNVPSELHRIVAKMLRKNVNERYQTMRDVFKDLKEFRETRPADGKMERPASTNGNKTAYMDAATGGAKHTTIGVTLNALSQSIRRNKPLTAFLSMGLLVSALGFGKYFYATQSTSSPGQKSIAVLPVRPLNAGARDELYEIGIADSLIIHLGTLKGLIVRPLKAMRKYSDADQDPIAAGREQRVDYVLASNYQLADGRIRLTAQLVNVADGHIEETYKSEKDLGNIFAIQDAVASEVRSLLHARLTRDHASTVPALNRGTANEQAYRLYLQGMYLVEKENLTDAKRAMEVFDEALKFDPNYAKAWAGKARAHCLYAHVGGDSPDAQFVIARPALERAFALDNDLAEAYAVRGIIEIDYDWDFAEGERQFRHAIELSPNSDIFYRWFATRLAGQGRVDEGVAMAKTAIDINPNYVNHQFHYGRVLYFARRYDDAIAQMNWVTQMDPSLSATYSITMRAYLAKGDGTRAYEALMKLLRMRGTKEDTLKNYEALYARGGWESALSQYLEELKTNNPNGSNAYILAVLSAFLGQHEQSLQYLGEVVNRRSLDIANLKGDPGLDSLRADPRFVELKNRIDSEVRQSSPSGH